MTGFGVGRGDQPIGSGRWLCGAGAAVRGTVLDVANMRGEVPLQVVIDGVECETHSTYTFAAGVVLVISTVLPERGLAFELVSTYVGTSGVRTAATHLALGPVGCSSSIEHVEHRDDRLGPVMDPRACAYDHAQQLIDRLAARGRRASVRVDEATFSALERVD